MREVSSSRLLLGPTVLKVGVHKRANEFPFRGGGDISANTLPLNFVLDSFSKRQGTLCIGT